MGLKSQIVIGRKGSQAQRTGSQAHQQHPPPPTGVCSSSPVITGSPGDCWARRGASRTQVGNLRLQVA